MSWELLTEELWDRRRSCSEHSWGTVRGSIEKEVEREWVSVVRISGSSSTTTTTADWVGLDWIHTKPWQGHVLLGS